MNKGDRKDCTICGRTIDWLRNSDGEVYWKEGHNAWPLTNGKCCSTCNETKVIPTRFMNLRDNGAVDW